MTLSRPISRLELLLYFCAVGSLSRKLASMCSQPSDETNGAHGYLCVLNNI